MLEDIVELPSCLESKPMYLLWLFIVIVAIFSCSCLKFGTSGLRRKSVAITAGRNLTGLPAQAISSIVTLMGVISGVYLLNGLSTMAYFYLKSRGII